MADDDDGGALMLLTTTRFETHLPGKASTSGTFLTVLLRACFYVRRGYAH